MEEILLRFTHIGEKTFKKISNKSLVKCMKVSKSWNNLISNQNCFKQRIHYENIQKDVDVNGETPLHKKVREGQLPEFKLIFEHVEDKNPTDKYGCTPLLLAAMFGQFDIFQFLINKVDENCVNNYGNTPLHSAASWGHLHICRLIFEKISDKNRSSNDGEKIIYLEAPNKGNFETSELISENIIHSALSRNQTNFKKP